MSIDFNENVMAANYSAAIVRLTSSYGISEEAILEGTGMTPAELHSADQVISINQIIRLASNAVSLTNTPHLGLMLGQHLSVTAHGMLGIAVMSSKNLGDALKIVCMYFKIRFSAFTAITEIKRGKLTLAINPDSHVYPPPETDGSTLHSHIETALHFFDEAMASSVLSIARLLTQQDCNEFTYQFAYPAPLYKEEYTKILGQNIHFNSELNCISAPASFAELPLMFYDEATLKTALKNCNKLLFKQQAHLLLKHKIKDILGNLKGEFPNLESLAKKLNMSSRTIRRKLQAEGTNYQTIVNETRKDLAKKFLRDPSLSIIQISSELNFNDPSYFARMFKQWTGSLPTEYRKQHLKL